MKSSFIYSFFKDVHINGRGIQSQNHLVLFFPYKNITQYQSDIQLQLRDYFHKNTLPDKLVIICFEYNKETVKKVFEKESEIYNYIPRFEYEHNENAVCVIAMNMKGEFQSVLGSCPPPSDIDDIYNRGLTKIFVKNGGLIVSQAAHHFVFPSGKHSNKFLRTGNVLINGTEIYFIASALIKHFKLEKFETLYSDTSSINSLAFTYINLMKELNPAFTESVLVESFGSYSMFEKLKFNAKRNTLFLISSSTSGSILERMTKNENRAGNIELKNIAIIYGLDVKSPYNMQVVCDLTQSPDNPDSLPPFDSYNVKKGVTCYLCESGSKPLKVEGDVFLLEKPLVTTHLIKKTDLPAELRTFSAYYNKLDKNAEPVIRCYHKENGLNDKKYEIYIDLERIMDEWENRGAKSHPYTLIFEKLEKYILQNIPAALKYMIVLPDPSSQKLALIISKVLNDHNIEFDINSILSIDGSDLKKINKEQKGSIAVISSSIVTGRNLLYLSRALRDYEKTYQRVFFTFVNRPLNKFQFDFLQSNLGLGEFGAGTHKTFNVETLYCSNEAQASPWHLEENNIKKLQDYLEDKEDLVALSKYCSDRIVELSECGKTKGLSDNLFFPSIKGKSLTIRSGFAFAPFATGQAHKWFISRSKQSEIYFIISSILNELRNKNILHQSEYVRNILDPGNFVRYNDGIIQACLLRAATEDELNYSLSLDQSLKMKSILGDMILHIQDDHAEALNEFFYAIAIKKLKLDPDTVHDCINLLEDRPFYKDNDSILKGLVSYIKEKVIIKESIHEKFRKLPLYEIKE